MIRHLTSNWSQAMAMTNIPKRTDSMVSRMLCRMRDCFSRMSCTGEYQRWQDTQQAADLGTVRTLSPPPGPDHQWDGVGRQQTHVAEMRESTLMFNILWFLINLTLGTVWNISDSSLRHNYWSRDSDGPSWWYELFIQNYLWYWYRPPDTVFADSAVMGPGWAVHLTPNKNLYLILC